MHISEPYIHPPLPLMADPAITKGEKKRGLSGDGSGLGRDLEGDRDDGVRYEIILGPALGDDEDRGQSWSRKACCCCKRRNFMTNSYMSTGRLVRDGI